jgi:CubicO group peptidase (beta-lactamase class C family)
MLRRLGQARYGRWLAVVALVVVLAVGGIYLALFDCDLNRGGVPPRETRKSAAFSPPEAAALRSAIEQARTRFEAVRESAQYPSMSIAVVQAGADLWAESIRFADLDSARPATLATRYPIGSVSKSLTATAALRLAEAGALDLDASISHYLPTLSAQYQDVTMRQLLSHQAGVRHYRFAWRPPLFSEMGLNRQFDSVDAGLSIFVDDPLLFQPDTDFSYSTYGYSLASRVMEVAGGAPFLELMKRLVFSPVGMAETTADLAQRSSSGRTTDYLAPVSGWGVMRAPAANSSYKWAGGGFISTPADLAHFGDALLSDALVSAHTRVEMMSPRRVSSGAINEQHYGLGWRSGLMPFPRGSDSMIPIVHHGGTAIGSECLLMLWPNHRLTVAVCGNANTGGSSRLLSLVAGVGAEFLGRIPNRAQGG